MRTRAHTHIRHTPARPHTRGYARTHAQLGQELALLQEKRNALASEIKARGTNKKNTPPSEEQQLQGRLFKEAAQTTAEALESVAADLDREARLLPNTTHAAAPPAGTPPRRILSFGPEGHKLLKERMNASGAKDNAQAKNGADDTPPAAAAAGDPAAAAPAAAAWRFRDHTEIARDADLLDFEAGARVAGGDHVAGVLFVVWLESPRSCCRCEIATCATTTDTTTTTAPPP
jgi:seryl-tRNA synthetase